MATKGRRSFGQRLIDLELRLRDGEVNLVGGIFDNAETQSLSGYPLLSRIPIPRYFFAQIGKQRQEDEIIFAITPHIVHSQELTEENLRLVDLSMGASVSVRHTDPRKVSALTTPAAHEAGSSQNGWKAATDQHETAPAALRRILRNHRPFLVRPCPAVPRNRPSVLHQAVQCNQ